MCGSDDPKSIFRLECTGSLHVRHRQCCAINDRTMPLAVRPPSQASPAQGMAGRTAGGSCVSLRIPSMDGSIHQVLLPRTLPFAHRSFPADAVSSCRSADICLPFRVRLLRSFSKVHGSRPPRRWSRQRSSYVSFRRVPSVVVLERASKDTFDAMEGSRRAAPRGGTLGRCEGRDIEGEAFARPDEDDGIHLGASSDRRWDSSAADV